MLQGVPMDRRDLPVAIIGGGFSGTLLAINMVRHGGRVVLIERDGDRLGRGLAYGTRDVEHLLNVRAANMSAFPDDAGHFLRWLGHDRPDSANRFVPRMTYGLYLRELLLKALAEAPDRLQVIEQPAQDILWHGGHAEVLLAKGPALAARAVVLALGHFGSAGLPQLANLAPPVLVSNPWLAQSTQDLQSLDHVLLVGTGLTAIDVALSLDKAGYGGSITALSRRGLLPRAHAESGPIVEAVARPAARGSWLIHHLRQRSMEVDWRQAIDELRPHTQSLWRQHDEAAQARFLRHARPWWDVHRHRLAPEVASRVAGMQAEGRLRFVAGRIAGAEPLEHGARVHWRQRGSEAPERLDAGRIILCAGPEGDLKRCAHPLLSNLLNQGMVRGDRHRLGLDVDHLCRVINAGGARQDHLFAVGPLTKGEAWEIIAVPDIRRQVWSLARFLTHAHWVGGEGL